tara:strand:+ start:11 stop:1066 length:1056 start_codon:yes stop_codon:yes gene_type:complete
MDEGRKNFLTYQIISGLKFITIEGVRYKLIAPSAELRLLSEHVYQETFSSLRFDNFITDERAALFLRSLGIWGPENAEALKNLEKHIEDKKVELFKFLYNSDKQKKTRRTLEYAKKSLNNALMKKHSLDYMTLSFHASSIKKRFLTAMCLIGPDNNNVYNEESFWNSDSSVLEQATSFLEMDIITVESIRELARSDPWRTMWNLGKESCLKVRSSEYTDDQRTLVTFAKMYDNAYQNMECPPDIVFEDDDMFDGWLIDQRREREKDQKQKQVDKVGNVPDSAQEVFVFAPTREDADKVYDLNTPDARVKIQQRQKFIENNESVEAKDLPDTKLELRKQQIEEYKSKLKGGK